MAANPRWNDYFSQCLYRPFDVRAYFHHEDVVELPRHDVMNHMLSGKNMGLITNRQVNGRFQHVLCSNMIINDCTVSLETRERSYLFPLYLYPDPNKKGLFDIDETSTAPGNRRPNFSPAFITAFSNRLNMIFIPDGKGDLQRTFGPEDVFSYIYALMYAPAYRSRYAQFLKVDFPRLPLTCQPHLFRALCSLGSKLVGLHLMETGLSDAPKFNISGSDTIEALHYTEPGQGAELGRAWINKEQYFEGIPPEVWNFYVGGYQVCQKWLKDRKGCKLEYEDVKHYQQIVAALAKTITLMEQIDETIIEHGGWPIM